MVSHPKVRHYTREFDNQVQWIIYRHERGEDTGKRETKGTAINTEYGTLCALRQILIGL